MTDTKRVRIYYEGNDDKALLEGLQKADELEANCEIASRRLFGKDGLVAELAPFVRPVNGVAGHAVALIDLDSRTNSQLADWFEHELRRNMSTDVTPTQVSRHGTPNPRVVRFDLSGDAKLGRVALVAVGLADDQVLRTDYGIEELAMDDYILRLALNEQAYAAVPDFKDVRHEIAKSKLAEMSVLLRDNGLPIRRSKRYLHLLRAVVGFPASSATFVQRMIEKPLAALERNLLREMLQPLLDDLNLAISVLDA